MSTGYSSTYAEVWYDRDQYRTWLLSFFEPDGTPSDRESETFHLKTDAVRRAAQLRGEDEICRAVVFFRNGAIERYL